MRRPLLTGAGALMGVALLIWLVVWADGRVDREQDAYADAECHLRFRAARTVAESVAVLDRSLGWSGIGCRGTLRRATPEAP